MSFIEQYAELETGFKEQVDRDNKDLGIESHFLANIAPKDPVDYILVAMEPSFGGGPGIPTPGKALNSRNFAGSLEDFILHHCVNEYLCGDERDYYLTDLSKEPCQWQGHQGALHSDTRGTRDGIRCFPKRSNLWRGLTH